MITVEMTGHGVAAAIAEINRRNFIEAEARLAEKMKPARLAASDAVIEQVRQSEIGNLKSAIR